MTRILALAGAAALLAVLLPSCGDPPPVCSHDHRVQAAAPASSGPRYPTPPC